MPKIKITLEPLGQAFEMQAGTPLADLLALHGVEFPCGGKGHCRGCRVRVLNGELAGSEMDRRHLSPEDLALGWRLACQARPEQNLTLELRQWSGIILSDQSEFHFTPQAGLGIAVDIGTTTMVAQLMDLRSGRVLATEAALNPQSRHGADIMSRILFARDPEGRSTLTRLVRNKLAEMVRLLCLQAPAEAAVSCAVLVGNTAMHHLFLGHDVAPLAAYPFQTEHLEGARLSGAELGWTAPADKAGVSFLPNLGGFVGSDILAVILATRLHESDRTVGAADLGTNGEIVFGDQRVIRVASTAAGPAFEGARISMGMRAAVGAIDRVDIRDGRMQFHVIGGGKPKGLCGSGLVDAVAAALDLGLIQPSGRLATGKELLLSDPVKLTQLDIRELQLAKGAIAAGIRILRGSFQLQAQDVPKFFLAGAFGNSLDMEGARRIGLLDFPEEAVEPVGNAALLGAKMTLFTPDRGESLFRSLLPRIEHVPLERHPDFEELYAECMGFL